MPSPVADITIAGAGPAGSALARAAAGLGARVVVVDPDPGAPWPARYGAWAHELAETDVGDCVAHRWDQVLLDTGAGPRRLPGAYVALDRPALQARLQGAARDGGATFRPGRVVAAEHDASGATLHLAEGGTLRTRRLVDATGRGVLLERPRGPAAFQAALGRLVRTTGHPWDADTAVLMDFSEHHLDPVEAAGPASFLYALPVSDDLVFVEETSLAAAPAVPLDRLGDRLDARLAHLGIQVRDVLEVERCLIPMDAPIPAATRTVGIGAGAGWVHPATGYQLTRALRVADRVAAALVDGLDLHPAAAARRTWRAVWPGPERRTRALHDLGLGLLLELDAPHTRAFFDSFFRLPTSAWRTYLDATSPPGAVAAAMSRTFAHLPSDLRSVVLRHALGRGRRELVRALTPQFGGAS
jgi:lycopene beta-cyclase